MSGASESPPVRNGMMGAWVLDRYGPPENLTWRQVPFPGFRDDNELLVRVQASSVNPADRHYLKPPLMFRRGRGLLRPRSGWVGTDFAGRVEVVGKNVKDIHVGDEVFGVARGAFGEYAVADQVEVAPKPPQLTFEDAAALPIAAVTALQGLRDKASVKPGMRVLINGGSGGVGTFAIQIAKSMGAHVGCVCSTQNVEQARSLGADRVFDYSREDFTRSDERWDVIFDTQLNHSLGAYRRVLNRPGLLLMVGAGGGSVARLLLRLLGKSLASRITGPKTKFFIARVKTADLSYLATLVTSGKLAARIDRRYPLAQVPAALRYLIEGHARAKISITFA